MGSDYRIEARCYKSDTGGDTLVYEGFADHITVGQSMATVIIVAQEVSPPPPYSNHPPRIFGVFLSSVNVVAEGTVQFSVTATDADDDELSYRWSDDGSGAFSTPAAPSTNWTAPASPTTYGKTIRIEVTDTKGSKAVLTFLVSVTGAVNPPYEVRFNNWPVVLDMQLSPTQIELGQSTTLTVASADPDGDEMSYEFGYDAADCQVELTPGTTPNEFVFTPTSVVQDHCDLLVRVTDGNGGTGYGYITVWVGALPEPEPAAGDKRVFVTSATVLGGEFNGSPTAADAFCQQRANVGVSEGKLPPGTYKALMSFTSVDARDRISNGRYVLPSGIEIAASKADLFDGFIEHLLNETEHGNTSPERVVLSGTLFDGTRLQNDPADFNCNGWTSSSNAVYQYAGVTYALDDSWLGSGASPCDTPSVVYCFQW